MAAVMAMAIEARIFILLKLKYWRIKEKRKKLVLDQKLYLNLFFLSPVRNEFFKLELHSEVVHFLIFQKMKRCETFIFFLLRKDGIKRLERINADNP